MAALYLAKLGHKVAVVDWRENIGDKLCTGIIGRECANRFPPDPSHIYHKTSAATIVSPNGRQYIIEKDEPQAYILDRVAYVNSIAEQAKNAGAEYLIGPRITSIQKHDDKISIATRSNDREPLELEAKILILASGFGSPLVRMAGLNDGKSEDYMIGCQAIVEAPNLEQTEVFVGSQVAPDSFAWIVPLADSKAFVGMAPRKKHTTEMDTLISNLQKSGKITEIVRETQTWGIPIKPLPKTFADRVLVVGDAAGLVKPTTGGGIYYAFLSGEMAAESAHDAIENGDFSARQLRSYERQWKEVFGKELRIGYYARMLFESLNDQQIETLLEEFLSDEVIKEVINARDFSFDWHGRVIMTLMRHTNVRRVLMSFGPAAATFMARLVRA